MKKIFMIMAMTAVLGSAHAQEVAQEIAADNDFQWTIDRFGDVRIMRYKVPEFENLPLEQKLLIYYLSESALSGRDIIYDQNFRLNLTIRATLEVIYHIYQGDKTSPEWLAFEKYLKQVWFANGIHHHYSGDKFVPEFSQEWFEEFIKDMPDDLRQDVVPTIFDPTLYARRINKAAGEDLLKTSAMNYYEGVTQAEAEKFYAKMAAKNKKDPYPVAYGLNSKLVKQKGKLTEQVWRIGGMYSTALERVASWLEKARDVAVGPQKDVLEKLLKLYRTGDLKDYDNYNIAWVRDTASNVDFVNGFTEVYGDPLGIKASWESVVDFVDVEATKRATIISDNAQWFEDNSPVDQRFKKPQVKGVSAKVITAAILAGDCYPATPIGINLPNSEWIRRDYGSKSVTIQNINDAYEASSQGNGSREEFVLRAEDRERMNKYGRLGQDLHTDLHECLGHGSGQLASGVSTAALGAYYSAIEEARADLFALWYIADPKLVELGLVPSLDVAWAEYAGYMMNGMMTQMARIDLGKTLEEAHMRNRAAIAGWCYERGRADNVIEKVVENGKTYIVVNDFEKLRVLVGKLLAEIQRIKSEGDFAAARDFIEGYGVQLDPVLHAEVKQRYDALGIAPYGGFVNPRYELVRNEDTGEIEDVRISYDESYAEQMLRYSRDYSFLPCIN